MFVGNYSYDNTIFQIPKKRLTGCSLVISLPIDTKTSYMHARPSSIQRGKGCDVFIRVRESLTTGTQDFEFSISNKETWKVGWSHIQMDKTSYRDVRMHLKLDLPSQS